MSNLNHRAGLNRSGRLGRAPWTGSRRPCRTQSGPSPPTSYSFRGGSAMPAGATGPEAALPPRCLPPVRERPLARGSTITGERVLIDNERRAHSMKITKVTTVIAGNPWKNWLFAIVETDEGLTGVGEGTLNAFARTVEAAIHELSQQYIGLDPFQPALIAQRMTRDVYSDGGQIHRCAVGAIEIACWDIMGKATGRS